MHDTYLHIAFDQENFSQNLSLKELTGYEWNLLADSAAFIRIHEYVYGVTLRVEGRQCSKAVRRL